MDPHATDSSAVSRDHVVSHDPGNDITFISGGKWTTWREMAEDVVDQVLERDPVLKQRCVQGRQAIVSESRGKKGEMISKYPDVVVQKMLNSPDNTINPHVTTSAVTSHIPLLGIGKTSTVPDGYHRNLAVVLTQQEGLAPDIAKHLVKTYGTRAWEVLGCVDKAEVRESTSGLYKHYRRIYEGQAMTSGYPYIEAEIVYAIR